MALISQIKSTDNATPYNVRDDVHTWGGRNLIWNSGNFQSSNFWATNATGMTWDIVTVDGYKCLHCKGSSSGGSSIIGNGTTGNPNICIYLEPSTTYTYHGWLKFAGTGTFTYNVPLHYWVYKSATRTGMGASNGAANNLLSVAYAENGTKYTTGSTLPANTWIHIIWIFSTIAATSDYPYINFRPIIYGNYVNTANNEYWLRNIKLECGNKPTDWSPAPEDIAHVNGECLELLS